MMKEREDDMTESPSSHLLPRTRARVRRRTRRRCSELPVRRDSKVTRASDKLHPLQRGDQAMYAGRRRHEERAGVLSVSREWDHPQPVTPTNEASCSNIDRGAGKRDCLQRSFSRDFKFNLIQFSLFRIFRFRAPHRLQDPKKTLTKTRNFNFSCSNPRTTRRKNSE